MNLDDVLVELRRFRDEFARSHGYDSVAIGEALREMDRAAGDRVVSRSPRPPAPTVVRVCHPPEAPARG